MPGFERNRFFALEDCIADGFTCIVCFNIFENPIITDCGHTYCHQCIQKSIQSGSNDCPKCRKSYRGRDAIDTTNNDNSVIVEHNQQVYAFVRNLTVNAIISQFKIKCDYEWNGCRAVVELGSLDSHLKNCEHRLCRTCALTIGNDDHNCIDLLKNEVNEWRIKCKQFELCFNEMKDKYSELEEQNSNNERLKDEWKVKCGRYGKKVELLKEKCSQSEARYAHSSQTITEWKQKCMTIYDNLKQDNSKLKQERKGHLIEISETKDKFEECNVKVIELNGKFENLQRQYDTILEANHQLKHHCVNLERTLYQLIRKISFLESENFKLNQLNNGLVQKNTESEKTSKELRIKIYDLEARIQEMQFSVESTVPVVPKSYTGPIDKPSLSGSDHFCKTCGLSLGSLKEHNCFKQLTREANRWRNKFEESENTLTKVRDKYANVVRDNLINIKESYRWRDRCENFERMAKELKKDMSTVEDKLRVCSLNFVNKEMNKWRQKCEKFEINLTQIDQKYSKNYNQTYAHEGENEKITDSKLIEDDKNNCDIAHTNDTNQCHRKDEQLPDTKDNLTKGTEETKVNLQVGLNSNPKQSLMYTENVNYVIFGTFRTKCSNFHINCNGILLKGVSPKGSPDSSKDVILPFQSMKELRFCSKLFSMALLIKATDVCTLDIQRLLQLGMPSRPAQTSKHCFYDLKQSNIIIALNKKNQDLLNSMSEWLSSANPHLKTESINWFKMKEIMDKIHT